VIVERALDRLIDKVAWQFMIKRHSLPSLEFTFASACPPEQLDAGRDFAEVLFGPYSPSGVLLVRRKGDKGRPVRFGHTNLGAK